MDWYAALGHLRSARRPAVLVTLTAVRGHAPRAAGAKMVVGTDETWDSIGGGNLEQVAISRARELITGGSVDPQTLTIPLSDKASGEFGQQCCGGEVSILLEPVPVRPSIAIFGMGHVGLELAHILARHPVELHLVDSRPHAAAAFAVTDAIAQVVTHDSPVPELVLGEVPPGTHVLVLTHDHAEDAAICDAALRCEHLASVGLIGSRAKWSRFRKALLEQGHDEARVDGIRTPIGDPAIGGKAPAMIALSVAAELTAALWPQAERVQR
ncbi:xanthine dehydrogenase accessory protein XdhC [Calidifontibacter sp. DB0510]|uniref:Xanthine dehydrogenase accessory protein XdhC n=1 Tax=Metallococcus carri TaxID=1656884 RepID=A0A967B3V5_9MICO|nr:xanthine dehydrogenase accessory protein XdhC [Metallococcus carri]NHN57058.1 xanthine dehydrogenase accessory protein XdhC [Metallococcus carri]NOP39073.1 xanthine dehydrogenase accessory protein XdhC [Calidifontibacter sp. DB2511S]